MKITLVGWDIDERVVGALARLGLECVAFTRWFAGDPVREEREGWVLIRCPHQIGGGSRAEAISFGESVLKSAEAQGLAGERDVVHALDPLARPALAGFKGWWPRAVTVASITEEDVAGASPLPYVEMVDRWVGDDPWIAERWRASYPAAASSVEVVESGHPEPPGGERRSARPQDGGPLFLTWLTPESEIDPVVVVEALARARQSAPILRAAVLGTGISAVTLRRKLARRGWLAGSDSRVDAPTLDRFHAWLARASVVGLGSASLPDDPVARASWLAGKPTVAIGGADPRPLADAILDTLYLKDRSQAEVRAGAAFARRRREPDEVALAWLGLYLGASSARGIPSSKAKESTAAPWEIGNLRSRLSLIAIDTRLVYAAWSVRPADWTVALEWLGTDAARSTLAIRLADVTASPFRGERAPASWDIELGFSESHRTIHLDSAGRSLAAQLGVRSPRGYFHTLAHSRLCHLPSEQLAPAVPTRRLRVLPRRDAV